MSDRAAGQSGPRLAAITVSYGSELVLDDFFDTLGAATGHDLTVVLADNKAIPGSRVEEIANSHGAHYLPIRSNAGYGGAINAAAATLPRSIEWILISNPDVTFQERAIDNLVARGDSDPRIGSVGPAILTAEGQVYPSARAIPSLRNGIGHALLAGFWRGNPWSAAYRNDDADPSRRRKEVGWLSGACLLVRRAAFDHIGGFDAEFFMYFEDVDLGYRLGKIGFTNVYEPAAVVTHTGAHSTSTEPGSMLSAHHESAKRFLAKKYSSPLLWPVRVILSAGLTARSWILERKNRKAAK